jgi:hypothetical protein
MLIFNFNLHVIAVKDMFSGVIFSHLNVMFRVLSNNEFQQLLSAQQDFRHKLHSKHCSESCHPHFIYFIQLTAFII